MQRIKLEEILQGKRKQLYLKQNEKHLQIEALSYPEQYHIICSLIKGGSLKPVKASGTNGKKPALYLEYWLKDTKDEDADQKKQFMEELQFQLTPAIAIDYYLKHLDSYKQDRQWVLLLDQYLKQNRNRSWIPISQNERSFAIWQREKFLTKEQGKKILKRCGLSLDELHIYQTSEPLSYYVHTREIPQNILILENKDTFYSMRRALLEGRETLLGVSFGTLIYGAGKGILRSFQDFTFCVEPYMRKEENTIYYFGDLDYEGILIYEKLAESFQRNKEIRPFTLAYNKMLNKVGKKENLPDTKEGQNKNLSGKFFSYFSLQQVEEILSILEKGRYIPQEILNIKDF